MGQRKVISSSRPITFWILVIIAVLLLAGLVVGGLFLLPRYQSQQATEQHYQAGVAFENIGDWEAAETEYKQVIAVDANYKDVQARLAQNKARQAEARARATAVSSTEAEQAQSATSATALAAQATAMAVPTITAEAVEARYQRALGLINLQEWLEAQQELRAIFDVDPDYGDVQTQLALVNSEVAKLALVATTAATTTAPPTSTPSPTPAHVPNFALEFDGMDDFVEVPLGDSLNMIPLTLEAWVRPGLRTDGDNFPNNVLSNDSPTRFGNGFGVNVWPSGSQLKIEMFDDWKALNTYAFRPGEWHHVAVVYFVDQVQAYIDGDLVLNSSYSSGSRDGVNRLRIGKHNDDTSYGTKRYFKGTIDEVRVWSIARSAEEIRSDMRRPLKGNETNLIGYWSFDEGQGSVILDASSRANHGTLGDGAAQSSPAWVTSAAQLE